MALLGTIALVFALLVSFYLAFAWGEMAGIPNGGDKAQPRRALQQGPWMGSCPGEEGARPHAPCPACAAECESGAGHASYDGEALPGPRTGAVAGSRLEFIAALLASIACTRQERAVAARDSAPSVAAAAAASVPAAVSPVPGPEADLPAADPCAFSATRGPDSLAACLTHYDTRSRACPPAHSWTARMSDGASRRVEWRRCGPQGGAFEGDSIVWPTHYLVIRRDSVATAPAMFVLTNDEEPGLGGLDTVDVSDLDGDGSDEVFIVNRIYGTGAMFEDCALTLDRGSFRCWGGPEFPGRAEVLRPGEVIMKGWIRQLSGPGADRTGDARPASTSVWYWTPVYRDGDANCCPSANASLWVEALPRGGRFVTGLWLRTREDSLQNILGIDTLRH